jgi:hypothetical protein
MAAGMAARDSSGEGSVRHWSKFTFWPSRLALRPGVPRLNMALPDSVSDPCATASLPRASFAASAARSALAVMLPGSLAVI